MRIVLSEDHVRHLLRGGAVSLKARERSGTQGPIRAEIDVEIMLADVGFSRLGELVEEAWRESMRLDLSGPGKERS